MSNKINYQPPFTITPAILRQVAGIGEAIGQRRPATLWAGQGTAGFAVNRRTNRESDLADLVKRGVPPPEMRFR